MKTSAASTNSQIDVISAVQSSGATSIAEPLAQVKLSTAQHTRSNVCLITSSPISYNPRALKEADALAAAGFNVRVVATQHEGWVARWDEVLMATRKWQLNVARWDHHSLGSKYLRFSSGLRQRLCKRLAKHATFKWRIAELAYCRLYVRLLKLACKEPADLYIAHNPQALPVACRAAEKTGAAVAFDSEDYHIGEFPSDEQTGLVFELLSYLETKYLPRCSYITAPSEAISQALARRYGVSQPISIHNVFAWGDRQGLDGKIKDRRGPALSLYWYSQVIGLNRGIQDCLRAAALLTMPVQIHLRGNVTGEVKAALLKLAGKCGVAERLYFQPIVHPDELLSRAAEHDVGLALEQPVNENKFLTVSNKLFLFFLAGLAVAVTDTTGQRGQMETCPAAGFLYPPGDYRALARELQKLLDEPELLRKRKAAALEAAQERWNWEIESQHLVRHVVSVLSAPNQ